MANRLKPTVQKPNTDQPENSPYVNQLKREETTKKEQNDSLLHLSGQRRQDSAVSSNDKVLKHSLELRRYEEEKEIN